MKSQRKSAITAGIALLLMAIAAGIAFGFAHQSLVDPTDSIETFQNIQSQFGLYLAEIAGWVLIAISDVIVSLAFFNYFKSIDKLASEITTTFRLIYTFILVLGIFQLVKVTAIMQDPSAHVQVLGLIQSFENYWSIGLIIFGLHLITLGYVVFKAKIHWIWGGLLIIAGFGYVLVHSMKGMDLPNVDLVESILMGPMTVGELGFAIWMIVRGGKKDQKAVPA